MTHFTGTIQERHSIDHQLALFSTATQCRPLIQTCLVHRRPATPPLLQSHAADTIVAKGGCVGGLQWTPKPFGIHDRLLIPRTCICHDLLGDHEDASFLAFSRTNLGRTAPTRLLFVFKAAEGTARTASELLMTFYDLAIMLPNSGSWLQNFTDLQGSSHNLSRGSKGTAHLRPRASSATFD